MPRIFAALALFAVVLLLAALMVALMLGDFGAASRDFQQAYLQHEQAKHLAEDASDRLAAEEQLEVASTRLREQQSRSIKPHFLTGLAAALVTVLVNSVSITYFIGTGRWCQEVVDAYSMDREFVARARKLKLRALLWALCGTFTMIAVAALGAAADPGRLDPGAAEWVNIHWPVAIVGVCVIGTSFWIQVGTIAANLALINEVLALAERMREERRQASTLQATSSDQERS